MFAEYAMDTADACHELGVKTVAVTAGYIHDEPRRAFFAKMDAGRFGPAVERFGRRRIRLAVGV